MIYPVVFPYLGFMVAGVADAYYENSTTGDRGRAIAKAIAMEIFGILGYCFVAMLFGTVVWVGGVEPREDYNVYIAQARTTP